MTETRGRVAALVMTMLCPTAAMAQDTPATDARGAGSLAQAIQNPIADLISVPIQNAWDFGVGPADATRFASTAQPIYPIHLSKDWNLVTRAIVPFIHQESPVVGGDDVSGLGDSTGALFLSPVQPLNGWIVGGGAIFQVPTATDSDLGAGKWGAGPTFVALKQVGPWSGGILLNHIWSFAGKDDRSAVINSLVNPFGAYTTLDQWTFAIQSEATLDWKTDQWTVPIEVQVAKLVMFGEQPVQFTVTARKFVERPAGGPDWGLGFNVTFLFPSK